MTQALHTAIAERAYYLWLNDGMKHGKAEHHWALAEKLLTQPAPVAAAPKKKTTKTAVKAPARTRAERIVATLHS